MESKINLRYIKALVDLGDKCVEKKISIREAGTLNNGFFVKFEGFDGDAVIHDFSYGHELGMWETYEMPWDEGDVSVHTSEELVELLCKKDESKDEEPINEERSEDHFISIYNILNASLKASVAKDIEMEEERYGK